MAGAGCLGECREIRAIDLAHHAGDLGGGVHALRLGVVGAGFEEHAAAVDRGIEAFDAQHVGAGADDQIAVAPGVEGGLDAGHHLGHGDDLLAGQIVAAILGRSGR